MELAINNKFPPKLLRTSEWEIQLLPGIPSLYESLIINEDKDESTREF